MKTPPPGPADLDKPPQRFADNKMLTPTLILGEQGLDEQQQNITTEAANKHTEQSKTQVSQEVPKEHVDTEKDTHVESPKKAPHVPQVEAKGSASTLPEELQNEPCMTPTEQLKALGKTPKPKGRPAKKASPKAKSKAKAKAKSKAQAKSKAKAKAKAKARSSKSKVPPCKRKVEGDTQEGQDDEEQEAHVEPEAEETPVEVEQQDNTGKDTKRTRKNKKSPDTTIAQTKQDETASSSKDKKGRTSKTDKAGKTSKASCEDATGSDHSAGKDTETDVANKGRKRAPKAAKTSETKPSKGRNSTNTEAEAEQKQLERKQRLSRKSSASHKARKAALQAGLTEQEAKAAAAKVS